MNQLLTEEEINRVIRAVDNTTSVFKKCDIFNVDVNEAHLLNYSTDYLTKSTMSLADLVRSDIRVTDEDTTIFIKIWFSWVDIPAYLKKERVDAFYRKDFKYATKLLGLTDLNFLNTIKKSVKTTSLDYEAKVYKYITDNIILKNISPNFIPLLTSHKCRLDSIIKSIQSFGEFNRKGHLLEKLKALHEMFPALPINFIMTGSARDMTSLKLFINDIVNGVLEIQQSEYSSITFQLFYTLYVMHEFRIVHNDNHTNNILIQTLPEEITLDFSIGEFNIKFSTKYIVKIFDWDRSYCEAIGSNKINSDHFMIRNVDRFVPGRDFSAFVCFIYARGVVGFNNILDRTIEGPKPSYRSNELEELEIENGITPGLNEWIRTNPEHILKFDNGAEDYFTINKHVLETLVSAEIIGYIREKFGTDQNGESIYDGPNVTNIYLGYIERENVLLIPKGFTCHPMYDSDDLEVTKYFTIPRKFAELCVGLIQNPDSKVYKYKI
jgi:hypothetical protein